MNDKAKSQAVRTIAATGGGVFRAGAAATLITPPLEVGLLMSSREKRWAPFEAVRSDLKARVLVVESGALRVALVSLDLLGLHNDAVGGWQRFQRAIAAAAGNAVRPDRIVVACTHTHNAPDGTTVTDLYRTNPFKEWLAQTTRELGRTISTAAAQLRPCQVTLGTHVLHGFSLQRRVPTPGGIVMSDSLQPIAPALMERGPVDHRVHGLNFREERGANVALLTHAVCHPVHEMCQPQVSADFPGELCRALEQMGEAAPLFFNGAAGDINPPTVSEGAEASRRHGLALADTIQKAAHGAEIVNTGRVAFGRMNLKLPVRSMRGVPLRKTTLARLAVLRLGSLALLFLPGEIFVETARQIEAASPFARTIVIGFAENTIGYVPTPEAFREGGYEIGPGRWSFLVETAEPALRQAATELLQRAWWAEPPSRSTTPADRE